MQFFPAAVRTDRPLARYLPPVGDITGVRWLKQLGLKPPAWVLDPFGVAPWSTAALARAGYTVLVTAFNPILRFLTLAAAHPLARTDLQAAIAALSASKKGSERMQPHIEGLYRTSCRTCGADVVAEAFVWERDGGAPLRVRYHCPYCRTSNDAPTDDSDSARAMRFTDADMHRARALERITPMNDPDREHATRALRVYPSRAVYALTSLINKRPLLDLSPERHRALDALLISALDAGNALWPLSGSTRLRQLHIPVRYLEHNLWLAMESAVEVWADESTPVPVFHWPDRPAKGGGVVIFSGRLRDLAPQLSDLPIQAIYAVLPRPHPAFWALSALWGGWLWGYQTVAKYKIVLRRQRYDWGWHTTALQAAYTHLNQHLPEGLPCLSVIPELEPGFLTAGAVGLHRAGFKLDALALRTDPPEVQIHWRTTRTPAEPHGKFTQAALAAVQDALLQAGQPLPELLLQAAALQGGVRSLPHQGTPTRAYSQTQRTLAKVLGAGHWRRFDEKETASGPLLWLRKEKGPPDAEPWFDRVERALVTLLVRQNGHTLEDIERHLCAEFPGLLTPPRHLITAILDSYTLPGSNQLRPEDAPARRRADLTEIEHLLRSLGTRLGFQVPPEPPVRWLDAAGSARYLFQVQASALLGRALLGDTPPADHPILVLPGGRAALVLFKLRHDPRLTTHTGQHQWRFLKFRLVRRLAELDDIHPEALPELLELDPISHTEPQIPLI